MNFKFVGILLLASFSLTSFAFEECKINEERYEVAENKTYLTGEFLEDASSWQECYEIAIKRASKSRHSYGNVPGNQVKWKFGILSGGRVNYITPKMIKTPTKGDVRYSTNKLSAKSFGNCSMTNKSILDGGFFDLNRTTTSTWQECYFATVKYMQTMRTYRYFLDWEFNDGYIDDSSGTVTAYSSMTRAMKGNRARNEDGSIIRMAPHY